VQVHINPEHAKQCDFICVDEVINDRAKRGKINFTYWQEVKKEIEELKYI
jgi:hypothetical protein